MHQYKRRLWKTIIAITGIFFLLLFQIGFPASKANAQGKVLTVATPEIVTVQATPTVDETVTALNKEQLVQQVTDQQHTWGNWIWSNAVTILSSLFSTLVIVGGALFGLWRWFTDRRDAQDKELKDRQNEREKRAEERFQSAVEGLGDEKEGVKIGASILLRTFLRPGYEQFYIQVFDLVVAHLRLPDAPHPPEDPGIPQSLTTLRQALIVVFKEVFPLARNLEEREPRALDATGVQLDRAYLWRVDLKQAWMRRASLQETNLFQGHFSLANFSGGNFSRANLQMANFSEAYLRDVNFSQANLREANFSKTSLRGRNVRGFNGGNFTEARLKGANFSEAYLKGANFSKADLTETNIEDALSLQDTDLRGVTGLTKEQLTACKTKGAIIDEAHMTKSLQSTVTVPPSLQSHNTQGPSTASVQADTPDKSSIVSPPSSSDL